MATIQELQAKVAEAQAKVEKAEKLLEKYKAQRAKKVLEVNKILEQNNIQVKYEDIENEYNLAHKYYGTSFHNDFYWAICDVSEKDSGIRSAQRKIEEAKERLKKAKERLGAEEAKIQYIQDSVPEVIKSFLEDWKRRVIKYYNTKAESYPEDYQAYKEEKSRVYFECLKETVERLVSENREEFINRYCYRREEGLTRILEVLNEEYKPNNDYEYINLIHFHYNDHNDPDEHPKYREVVERFNAKYGDGFFQAWLSHKFDKDWLEKEIEQEKNNKLIDLMNRVTKITGTITDAKGLYLENGDINGIIVGERGKAKVQTIGAGGYNEHVILDSGRRGQCFHFRVLINEIR